MGIRILAAIALAGAASCAGAAELRTATLDVKGMDCAACPVTVKLVLEHQRGVSDVKMDAARHVAVVTFDPAKASADTLAEAVTEAGYPTKARR